MTVAGDDAAVASVAVEGNNVVLALTAEVAAGAQVVVSYTAGTNPIRDEAGNPVAAFRQSLTAAGSGKPLLQSASAVRARLSLTYDLPLDPGSVPAPGAFTLHMLPSTTGERLAYHTVVATVTVEGRTAVLGLREAVGDCEGSVPLTVTYANPGASPLQGLDGTDVDEFEHLAVTNERTHKCGNSEATEPPPSPLTASFEGVPEAHDGRKLFSFELVFSENFPGSLDYRTLRDGAFTVTNGAVRNAKRVRQGQNRRWTITVRPASDDDVTVTLPEGAVTTESGRKLANAVSATVAGPPEPPPPPPPDPLTASFQGVPAAHDGRKAFSFELVFSENFPGSLDYRTLRDGAFTVTNGAVRNAKRVRQGQNRRWTITVRPDSDDDVTITLAAGAVTTEAGRKLTNAVSATVAGPPEPPPPPPPDPLTASFQGVPAAHDGRKLFSFELVFSENFPGRIDYKTLRDGAFTVTNGRVRGAKRVRQGQNRRWTITVRPASNDDVTVRLPAGSVTTEAGRALANTVSATVRGPALLSVADVEATEGEDEQVVFSVSLSRAATGTVSVDYRTVDGTAKAGEDYTSASGTLSFAAGQTSKTVEVPLLDDAVDDDGETISLVLSNPSGAALGAGRATATIHNADPLPKAWLARFGRTGAMHVVGILDARFEAAPGGDRLTLGGRAVDVAAWRASAGNQRSEPGAPGHTPPDHAMGTRSQSNIIPDGPDSGPAPADPAREATLLEYALWQALTHPGNLDVDQRRFLSQSSFHLSLTNAFRGTGPATESIETARAAPEYPGHWSLWGQGALTQFRGEDNGVNLDGDVLTGLVGVDYAKDRWLAGVALAWHDGDGSYRAPGSGTGGDLDSTLVTVNPYLRYALSPRLSLWGTLGYGTGTLQLRQERESRGIGEAIETDMSLGMGALGLRGVVYASAHTELALKSDALWVRTASGETDGLRGTEADTRRLRLLLSGRHQRTLANDALLSPTFELGIRYDDGDAETGFGMELGGGLRYADPVRGLTVETRARALIAHEDGSYEEWGLGGSLALDPGRLGRGLALRLDSGWGLADGNAKALWQRQTTAGLAPQQGPTAQTRFNAELGYGLDVPWTWGVLTPYGGMEWAGPGRALKLGWRFELGRQLSLSLDGERREDGRTRAEHVLMLRTSLPW